MKATTDKSGDERGAPADALSLVGATSGVQDEVGDECEVPGGALSLAGTTSGEDEVGDGCGAPADALASLGAASGVEDEVGDGCGAPADALAPVGTTSVVQDELGDGCGAPADALAPVGTTSVVQDELGDERGVPTGVVSAVGAPPVTADDLDYHLPAAAIAQSPLDERDQARLLVDHGGHMAHHRVCDLPDLLGPGDVVVVNDTRVLPARLQMRRATGGAVEVLLLAQRVDGDWEALVRPSRKLRQGELVVADNSTGSSPAAIRSCDDTAHAAPTGDLPTGGPQFTGAEQDLRSAALIDGLRTGGPQFTGAEQDLRSADRPGGLRTGGPQVTRAEQDMRSAALIDGLRTGGPQFTGAEQDLRSAALIDGLRTGGSQVTHAEQDLRSAASDGGLSTRGSQVNTSSIGVEIGADLGEGRRVVRLHTDGRDVFEVLAQVGIVPLPPYITSGIDDPERYQTVYARRAVSAAAPTAGLHFTEALLERVRAVGAEVVSLELAVGLDTFRPVTAARLDDHVMHSEAYHLPDETQQALARAARVVAVGTTVVRGLETWAATAEASGHSSLFIRRPYPWRVVDVLMTNFHLPRSTLLCLLDAFVGPRWRTLYAEALDQGYRFLSFGDAMLMHRTRGL